VADAAGNDKDLKVILIKGTSKKNANEGKIKKKGGPH
jgi:hypothetical protein